MMKELLSVSQLNPADYNPRAIGEDAVFANAPSYKRTTASFEFIPE
jgi:hypothetical protein